MNKEIFLKSAGIYLLIYQIWVVVEFIIGATATRPIDVEYLSFTLCESCYYLIAFLANHKNLFELALNSVIFIMMLLGVLVSIVIFPLADINIFRGKKKLINTSIVLYGLSWLYNIYISFSMAYYALSPKEYLDSINFEKSIQFCIISNIGITVAIALLVIAKKVIEKEQIEHK